MDLPGPNRVEEKPIIPEMNGPVQQQAPSGRDRILGWIRLAVAVLIALAVLWLLFLGGRWLVHTASHHSTKAPAGSTTHQSQPSKSGSNESTGSTPSTSSGSGTQTSGQGSGSTTSPSQPSSSATQPAATGSNGLLTNTGPGSTAAIFLLATGAGAAAYQVVLRRRNSKN